MKIKYNTSEQKTISNNQLARLYTRYFLWKLNAIFVNNEILLALLRV